MLRLRRDRNGRSAARSCGSSSCATSRPTRRGSACGARSCSCSSSCLCSPRLAAARPFTEHPAGLARDLVLVIDASASMCATDVFPDRLTAAKRAALEQMVRAAVGRPGERRRGRRDGARRGQRGRPIAADHLARSSRSRPPTAAADLTDALKLAGALAERARGAEILVVTDDAGRPWPRRPTRGAGARPDCRPRTRQPGDRRPGRPRRRRRSQAHALRERRQLLSIAVTRRLQILADGTPVTARDLFLDPLTQRRRRHRRAARGYVGRRGAAHRSPTRDRPGSGTGALLRPVGRPAGGSTTPRGRSCPARPTAAHPARRAGQRLPPERVLAAAQRRAVRRDGRGLRDARPARSCSTSSSSTASCRRRCPTSRSWPSPRPRRAPSATVTGTLDAVRHGPAGRQTIRSCAAST